MKKFLSTTVFNPLEKVETPDKILAVLFHRSAATLYLIYFAWGLTSLFQLIPTIFMQQGSLFQQIFSVAVVATSGTAFVGATFFPRTGRLELFAGAAVTALITFYVGSLFFAGLTNLTVDGSKIPAAVYGSSHLVVPIARTIFIYKTLTRVAAKEQ